MADDLDPMPALDPSLAELLDAYKGHTHRSAIEVEAALQRVAAKVTVAAPAGSAGATSVAKIAFATAVAAGGAWLATRTPEPAVSAAAHAPATTVEALPRAPAEPAPAEPVARIGEPVAVEPLIIDAPPAASPEHAAEPPRPSPAPHRKAKPRAHATEDTNATSLAEELALLREARIDLRAGRAREALRRVSTHRQRHPGSTFAEERDATEILALCALGRIDDARDRADAFSLEYPASTRDLLGGCDDAVPRTTPPGASR